MTTVKPKLSILVLEGHQTELLATQEALAPAGFRLCLAQSIEGALPYVDVFDLALINYCLPPTNGAEARIKLARARTVRELAFYYLCTSDTVIAARARAFGFDGVFPAQGDRSLLAAKLESVGRLLTMRRLLRRTRI